jgi:hypothetical protein
VHYLDQCSPFAASNKCTVLIIQGVSGEIVNILGGGSSDYSE